MRHGGGEKRKENKSVPKLTPGKFLVFVVKILHNGWINNSWGHTKSEIRLPLYRPSYPSLKEVRSEFSQGLERSCFVSKLVSFIPKDFSWITNTDKGEIRVDD